MSHISSIIEEERRSKYLSAGVIGYVFDQLIASPGKSIHGSLGRFGQLHCTVESVRCSCQVRQLHRSIWLVSRIAQSGQSIALSVW